MTSREDANSSASAPRPPIRAPRSNDKCNEPTHHHVAYDRGLALHEAGIRRRRLAPIANASAKIGPASAGCLVRAQFVVVLLLLLLLPRGHVSCQPDEHLQPHRDTINTSVIPEVAFEEQSPTTTAQPFQLLKRLSCSHLSSCLPYAGPSSRPTA